VLTKPVGSGVITTAAKNDRAEPAHLQAAVDWMLRLNGSASRVFAAGGVRACTDITGFGLLGHASEMAQAGGTQYRISASAVPLMDGALAYVKMKQVPGGTGRNREYLISAYAPGEEAAHPTGTQAEVRVRVEGNVRPDLMTLLFDPQTSGGLLAAVPPAGMEGVRSALEAEGVASWEIGEVAEGRGVVVEP
jgi:selenide,water dikinase